MSGETGCYCHGGSVHPQCPTHAAAWLAKIKATSGETGGVTAAERAELYGSAVASLPPGYTRTTEERFQPLVTAVERILAARGDQAAALARVEALAREWESDTGPTPVEHMLPVDFASDLRAALRLDPNPEEPA